MGSLVFFLATAEFRARLLAEGVVPLAVPGADAYVRHMQELVARRLAASATPSA